MAPSFLIPMISSQPVRSDSTVPSQTDQIQPSLPTWPLQSCPYYVTTTRSVTLRRVLNNHSQRASTGRNVSLVARLLQGARIQVYWECKQVPEITEGACVIFRTADRRAWWSQLVPMGRVDQ
jgi:hypothetical protein